MSVPFLDPLNRDRPNEWGLPSELLELLDNDGKAYFSPEGRAALNRLALGEWYLVRNRPELDDVLMNRRCRHCNQLHAYVSVACVPAPFCGLRQLTIMLRNTTVRDLKARAIQLDDIEVISAAQARTLNQRIRDRRGRPPVDQHPPRRDELDADLIRRRILTRAARIRRAAARAA
jgi:hypothetical protein